MVDSMLLTLCAGFIVANNPNDRVQLRFDLRSFEAAMAVGMVRIACAPAPPQNSNFLSSVRCAGVAGATVTCCLALARAAWQCSRRRADSQAGGGQAAACFATDGPSGTS